MMGDKLFLEKLYDYLRRNPDYHQFLDLRETYETKYVIDILKHIQNNPKHYDFNKAIKHYLYRDIESFDERFKYNNAVSKNSKLYNQYMSNEFLFKTDFDKEFNSLLKSNPIKLLKLWIMLILENTITYSKLEIKSLKDYLSFYRDESFGNRHNSNQTWYRGQSNFDWGLVPSMYRSITRDKVTYIDQNALSQKYNTSGLSDKYRKVFEKRMIDYEFLSYMQHAISYSPLLDFTSDFIIATSFALSNRQDIESFHNKDSAIFRFSYNGNSQKQFDVNDLNLAIAPSKIGDLTLIDWAELFRKNLISVSPVVTLIDGVSNDRMKYQKGKFILFDRFTLLSDRIPLMSSSSLSIQKIKISSKAKEDIYDYIREHFSYYSIRNLMNPYAYFSE